jgi:hypothetical protein
MSALDSFDWFKQQVWQQIDEDGRRVLEAQRQDLLTIRNEDERWRFLAEVMEQVKRLKVKKS